MASVTYYPVLIRVGPAFIVSAGRQRVRVPEGLAYIGGFAGGQAAIASMSNEWIGWIGPLHGQPVTVVAWSTHAHMLEGVRAGQFPLANGPSLSRLTISGRLHWNDLEIVNLVFRTWILPVLSPMIGPDTEVLVLGTFTPATQRALNVLLASLGGPRTVHIVSQAAPAFLDRGVTLPGEGTLGLVRHVLDHLSVRHCGYGLVVVGDVEGSAALIAAMAPFAAHFARAEHAYVLAIAGSALHSARARDVCQTAESWRSFSDYLVPLEDTDPNHPLLLTMPPALFNRRTGNLGFAWNPALPDIVRWEDERDAEVTHQLRVLRRVWITRQVHGESMIETAFPRPLTADVQPFFEPPFRGYSRGVLLAVTSSYVVVAITHMAQRMPDDTHPQSEPAEVPVDAPGPVVALVRAIHVNAWAPWTMGAGGQQHINVGNITDLGDEAEVPVFSLASFLSMAPTRFWELVPRCAELWDDRETFLRSRSLVFPTVEDPDESAFDPELLNLLVDGPHATPRLVRVLYDGVEQRRQQIIPRPRSPPVVIQPPLRQHQGLEDGLGYFLDGRWVRDAHNALHGTWAAVDRAVGPTAWLGTLEAVAEASGRLTGEADVRMQADPWARGNVGQNIAWVMSHSLDILAFNAGNILWSATAMFQAGINRVNLSDPDSPRAHMAIAVEHATIRARARAMALNAPLGVETLLGSFFAIAHAAGAGYHAVSHVPNMGFQNAINGAWSATDRAVGPAAWAGVAQAVEDWGRHFEDTYWDEEGTFRWVLIGGGFIVRWFAAQHVAFFAQWSAEFRPAHQETSDLRRQFQPNMLVAVEVVLLSIMAGMIAVAI